jgi:single-strand DNA-binding protein
MDLNTVTLSGNLTRDPELRSTASGKPVVSLRIGNKRFGDRSNFIDVVAWDKLAELVTDIYSKGDLIVFTGELQTREYTDKEGKQRSAFEIVARDVKLPPKNQGQSNAPDDEILF